MIAWDAATLKRALCPRSLLCPRRSHLGENGKAVVLCMYLLKNEGKTGSQFRKFFRLFWKFVVTTSEIARCDPLE
jgi:hypothetical protein